MWRVQQQFVNAHSWLNLHSKACATMLKLPAETRDLDAGPTAADTQQSALDSLAITAEQVP